MKVTFIIDQFGLNVNRPYWSIYNTSEVRLCCIEELEIYVKIKI